MVKILKKRENRKFFWHFQNPKWPSLLALGSKYYLPGSITNHNSIFTYRLHVSRWLRSKPITSGIGIAACSRGWQKMLNGIVWWSRLPWFWGSVLVLIRLILSTSWHVSWPMCLLKEKEIVRILKFKPHMINKLDIRYLNGNLELASNFKAWGEVKVL